MIKVSAIICVYNEEKTIKNIVVSASINSAIDEIIVVNDGSSDKTNEILTETSKVFDFKHIVLPKNRGKGFAMATGIENVRNEIIIFIDADLLNLNDEHFLQLLTPMIKNEADMVLGQATETLINYGVNPFKSFTGQRAMLKKDVIPIVEKMKNSRFGVETLINLYYQSQGKKVKYVMLEGLVHPTKFDKTTTPKAIKEFIHEGHQIALTVFKNFSLLTKSVKKTVLNNL